MDVLRESIGLLQLPYEDEYYYDEETINEFTLPWNKRKKQRNALKRLGLRLAGGIGGYYAGKALSKHNGWLADTPKNASTTDKLMFNYATRGNEKKLQGATHLGFWGGLAAGHALGNKLYGDD